MKKMEFVRKGLQKKVRMLTRMVVRNVLKIVKLSADKYFTRSNFFLMLGCSHHWLSDN